MMIKEQHLDINQIKSATLKKGEIALVGAGPGDAELLTIRALRFIQQADIAVYDRLVSDEIMNLLPPTCERIYVGKKQAKHHVTQDRINEILVEQAMLGRRVLRLKGGDPFVFGRGGEEAQFALQHGISCHVCPGITAASGCTAFAGIPLTHRGVAQGCTFITGHMQESGDLDLPWQSLVSNKQTVVFYMGIKTLPEITENLIKNGRSPVTPAVLIFKGTQPEQKIYRGSIENLQQLVEQHNIKPPTLIVIGEVVNQITDQQLSTPGYIEAQEYNVQNN